MLQQTENEQDEKRAKLKKETESKIVNLVEQNKSLEQENEELKKKLSDNKQFIENILKSPSQQKQVQQVQEKEKLIKIKNENTKQDADISTNGIWINVMASLVTLLGVQSNLSVRNEAKKTQTNFDIISETVDWLYCHKLCLLLP